ncbi:SAM-dependent methyltransferase [Corynebacterium suranareeae]|uniref:SAM-dependent methyltransferase n=1 Tax=Corynebacterium suranareeae TaxID=2506452 RepID=A0A160PRT3_9CORY|nr:SAM-dependent methyltransferase [Corynebacterium suranareeae]
MTSPELQNILNNYWSGRAQAYHLNQTQSERARFERPIWEAVWSGALPDVKEDAVQVLDLGCGSGYVTHLLSDCGFKAIGVDGSEEMINQAKQENERRAQAGKATATFHIGDAHDPAFPEGSFDAITSRYVLWTLLDPQAAINRWVSLLKPGGVIACVDAAWYPEGIDAGTEVDSVDGPGAFVETYTPELLQKLPMSTTSSGQNFAELFHNAGLRDVTVTPIEGLAELDQRFGLSPGHESTPQFLFRGVKSI